MKLVARITRLERFLPAPARPCPGCSGIGPQGAGPFYGGTRVPWGDAQHPDQWWCMCKYCHRRFTCRMTHADDREAWVQEVTFMPAYRLGDMDEDLI